MTDAIPTPREPSTRPVSGDGCPPRGRTETGLSPVSVRPLTGCMADYDDLSQAVSLYRSTWARPDYECLRDAALRCGLPTGEPPLSWAQQRLASYRNMIGA